MTMSFGSKLQLQPGSWLELVYDVVIGIFTGARHSLYLSYKHCIRRILRTVLFFVDFDDDYDSAASSGGDAAGSEGLKVVAVGYGRTGTVSFEILLESRKCRIDRSPSSSLLSTVAQPLSLLFPCPRSEISMSHRLHT